MHPCRNRTYNPVIKSDFDDIMLLAVFRRVAPASPIGLGGTVFKEELGIARSIAMSAVR
jgi:hypothetical protein